MRCGDPLGAFHYIYTVENDGKDELLTELLKSNLDQWDRFLKKNVYRDRSDPHRPPLPHHAAYGSVLRGSADQAESDPGGHKPK